MELLIKLIHPSIMLGLFAYFNYAAYLGFQVRQTRKAEGDLKKELVKGRFNLRHYQAGSILLAVIIVNALLGILVTYLGNGKLFVGPHLIVGLSIIGLIAISASLAPFMQRGFTWVRTLHMMLNIVLLGLFSWQVFTGLQGVQSILSDL